MPDTRTNTIYELLTKGVSKYTDGIDIVDINNIIRPMLYEAVIWPDKSLIVLKDRSGTEIPISGWKESQIPEIKRVMAEIVAGRSINSSVIADLVNHGWVEYDRNNKPVLTIRSLVQFDRFIQEMNGRYKPCNICGFLCDDTEYHDFCERILINKRIKTGGQTE